MNEDAGFRHEAMLYAGLDDFVTRTAAFLNDGLAAGEPALVVVDAAKGALLREELGDPEGVTFEDMRELGRNPSRIIPAWRDFLDRHPGREVRGIGEPIWPGRTPDELDECVVHESLLNHAFAATGPWQLACPYDMTGLDPAVLELAMHTHPYVTRANARERSATYRPDASFGPALPAAPESAPVVGFNAAGLATLRRLVAEIGDVFGLTADACDDLVAAVAEVAANSIRHGAGRGELRVWESAESLVCEIRDDGRIPSPLAGRRRPVPGQESGLGLWLVNQLCDLVQVRSTAAGSVVRLHMRRR